MKNAYGRLLKCERKTIRMLPSSKNVECGALAHMPTNKKPPQKQVYLHLWENSSRIRYGRLLTLRPGLQQGMLVAARRAVSDAPLLSFQPGIAHLAA